MKPALRPRDLARLLRSLAKAIEASSESDLAALLDGNASLVLVQDRVSRQVEAEEGEVNAGSKAKSALNVEETVESLIAAKSRDEAEHRLDEGELRRADLEAILRHLDLPVRKTDKVERIKEMIVNATVGARLDSHAIRGD